MSKFYSTIKFINLVTALYFSFLTNGTLHEKLYTTNFGTKDLPLYFKEPFLVIIFSSIFQVLFASFYLRLNRKKIQEKKRPKNYNEREEIISQKSILKRFTSFFTKFIKSMKLKGILLPSILQSISIYCTNRALLYVPFPLAIIFKSIKLVPVMIVGRLLLKRKYSKLRYLSAFLIILGLIFFTYLNNNKNEKSDSEIHKNLDFQKISKEGIFFLILSLCLDGLVSFVQENTISNEKVSPGEYMLKAGRYTIILFTVLLYFKEGSSKLLRRLYSVEIKRFKEIKSVFSLTLKNLENFDGEKFYILFENLRMILSESVIFNLLCFSFLQGLGMVIIVEILFSHGTLILVTCTTLRKFLSVLLSNFFYGHGISEMQWVCVSLVFGGLGLNILDKVKESIGYKGKNKIPLKRKLKQKRKSNERKSMQR